MQSNSLKIMFLMLFLCITTIYAVDSVTLSMSSDNITESFTIELPNGSLTKATEAFAALYGYQEKIIQDGIEIDNPVSKTKFMGQQIKNFCIQKTREYQTRKAIEKATDNVNLQINLLENAIEVK